MKTGNIMSIQGEILLHVLEKVLEIDPTEISAIHKNGMRTMTMLRKISFSTLDKWHEKDKSIRAHGKSWDISS